PRDNRPPANGLRETLISDLVSAWRFLRVAPVVENTDLMNALKRAGRGTPLFRIVFPIEVFHCVLLEWNSRITTLLRAPVDQPVLANVEITRACTAAPLVRPALGDAVLEPVEPRVVLVTELLNLLEDMFLFRRKWLQ